jgi:competence protein ComEC
MTAQSETTKLFSKAVLVFIFSFIFGILVSSFYFLSPLFAIFIIFMGISIISVEKILNGSVYGPIIFISIIFIASGLGILRYAVKDFHESNLFFSSNIGQAVEFEGIVVTEPEFRENTTRFVVSSLDEKILVSDGLYSEVSYGDLVSVKGRLNKPGVIDDGIRRAFDYGAYLSREDIYYTLSFAKVEIVSKGHGNLVKAGLFKIKHALVERMRIILPEPESSLLAGLVVAGKGAMPKDILEEFRRAGIIHIVVLSGYNVTIIAVFITKFFEAILMRIPRIVERLRVSGPRLAAGFSIAGILLFVLMTGGEATVVRASIMALAVILAKVVGGNYSAPRALLIAAFVMVVINPKVLVFDPSFELSFLATCGLIWLAPIFEKWLVKIPEFLGFRAMLATTIATQTAVLPFLVWSMGDVSLVSLPANVLVLLFIPAAMGFGFMATLLSFVSPIIALPVSFIAHLILVWILGVSSVLGNLSFASITVSQFPFWVVVLIYIGMIILTKRHQNFSPPHRKA